MMANPKRQRDDRARDDDPPTPEGSVPTRDEALDELVEEWGWDSFPASDPPGCLPPTMMERRPKRGE